MLADKALSNDSEDLLGFKPFADAISGVIDSPHTATPFVMALNAKWGAGKTTLGQMVQRRLEGKPAADGYSPHITCWFNAWMHDDAPTLSSALAAEVAQVANKHRSWVRRVLSPLPSALASTSARRIRKGAAYFSIFVIILGVFGFVGLKLGNNIVDILKFDPRVIKSMATAMGGAYATAAIAATVLLFKAATTILPVAKSLAEFVKDPKSPAGSASMGEVRRQLGKLIKQAVPEKSRFVIFIDDLDRCQPPRAVDILEITNQLLDHPDVVVIFMADMRAVVKSAEIKYSQLLNSRADSDNASPNTAMPSFGWDYLQKVVQLQFDLPAYSVSSISAMLSTLAKKVPEANAKPGVRTGLNIATRKLRRLPKTIFKSSEFRWGMGLVVILIIWADYRFPSVAGKIAKHLNLAGLAKHFGLRAHTGLFFVLIACLLGLAVLLAIVRFTRELWSLIWTFYKRREIDERIRDKVAHGERDFSKVEASVRYDTLATRRDITLEGLVRERLQHFLEDESELQIEAEDEVMKHLEPIPRHAKRLLNRLRLLLFVAHERKVFGGLPIITSRHIGKWAVLCERWPALAIAIGEQPDLMERLEDPNQHDTILKFIVGAYSNDAELSSFCLGETRLGAVIARILRFESAGNSGYWTQLQS
jgi:hypothetical protein